MSPTIRTPSDIVIVWSFTTVTPNRAAGSVQDAPGSAVPTRARGDWNGDRVVMRGLLADPNV